MPSGAIGSSFTYKGGTFPGLGGSCGATVAAGSACMVVVTFTPLTATTFTGTLSLNYNDGTQARTATRPVTGLGTSNATLVITDFPSQYYSQYGLPADGPSYDFGQIGIGSVAEHEFVITNNGAVSATNVTGSSGPSNGFAYKGGSFPGTGGTCVSSGSLAIGASCTVVVTYQGTAGTSTASFTVGYNDGTSSVSASRSLTGTGTAAAALTVWDFYGGGSSGINLGPTWDFGTLGVGRTAFHTFLVINSGGAAAAAVGAGAVSAGFSFPGGFPGGVAGSPAPNSNSLTYCGMTLAANAACAVTVQFSPTAATAYSGSFAVSYDTTSTASRAVRGVGTALALLSILEDGNRDGIVFNYGLRAVPSTNPQVFLVTNDGAQPATMVTALALPAAFAYSGTGFPGGTGMHLARDNNSYPFCAAAGSINPGAKCAISVDFKPTATATYSGEVRLAYSDGGGSPTASRSVQGAGTTQAIVSIATCMNCGSGGGNGYDLGFVPVNTTRTVLALLSNNGASASSLTDGGLTGSSAFTYQGGTFPGGTGTASFYGTDYPFCGPAPFSLASGAKCLIRVLYTAPATSGNQSASVSVNTATATTASVRLDLSAASTTLAVVSISTGPWGGGSGGGGTPTHNFGSVPAGSSQSVLLFIKNNGAAAATLTGGAVSGSGYAWSGGTYPGGVAGSSVMAYGSSYDFCPTSGGSLPGGATCVVSVTYSASGTSPQIGSSAIAVGNATTNSLAYNFSGSPTTLAIIALSECSNFSCNGGGGGTPAHDFGPVASPSTTSLFLFVRNTGTGAATVTNTGVSGAGFAYSSGTYPGGTAGASVNVNGSFFNYCPASGGTLPGGSVCVLSITYSASGSSPQNGTLSLGLTGATTSSAAFNFSGSPTTLAVVSIKTCDNCGGGGGGQTPTHDFGFMPTGSSASVFFFVRNTGNSAATLTNAGLSGSAFSYAGGSYPGGTPGAPEMTFGSMYNYCPASGGSLASGGICVLKVNYAASGTSQQQGGLSISLTGATAPSLAYNLQGTPTTQAIVSITDCPNCGGGGGGGGPPPGHDFGFVPSPSTVDLYLLIRNTGVGAATVTPSSLTGTGYSYSSGSYPGGTAGSSVVVNGDPFNFCPASGGSLAGGSTCVLSVRYSATGTTPQTGNLAIALGGATTSGLTYNLSAIPTTLAIVGLSDNTYGGSGACCGQTPKHDFGTVASPSVVTAFFFLRNTGTGAAMISSGGFTGTAFGYAGGAYPGGTAGSAVMIDGQSFNFCPASGGSLAGGASCVLQLAYSASGSTPQLGSVTINLSGATTSSLTYDLTGSPTTGAIISITTCPGCGGGGGGGTPTHDFGVVASPSTRSQFFYVKNSGAGAATLTTGAVTGSAFAYSGGAYPGGTAGSVVNIYGTNYNYCPVSGGSLAVGATCVLQLTYSATGTMPQSGGFTLTLGNASAPTAGFNLIGTPTTSAIVKISTCVGCGEAFGTFDYGTTANSADVAFVLQNTGAASAMLTDGATLMPPFTYTSGSYPGGTGSTNVYGQPVSFCQGSLAPGAACALSVRYSGAATATSSITVTTMGAYASSVTLTVKGTTTTRALLEISDMGVGSCTDASCGPADLGTLTFPQSTTRDFTVTNRGAQQANLGTGAAFSAAFGYAGTGSYPGGAGASHCGATLAVGASCVVTIKFSPPAGPAAHSSAINLVYSDAVGAITPNANRNIRGTGN